MCKSFIIDGFLAPDNVIIISNCNAVKNLRYVYTGHITFNGEEVRADIYDNGIQLYAVIC